MQSRDRISAALSVFLTGLAFLPSCVGDYATMDQWRAFRYSLRAGSGSRLEACRQTIRDFYVMTGRPLVWSPECVEHALVTEFDDFSQLRLPMLILTLVAVVSVGWSFNTIIKRTSLAYAGAALVIMTPAFSFMALQGVTAAAVVATIPLSAASFVSLTKMTDGSRTRKRRTAHCLSAAGFLLVALFIYPAWAFIVVSFSIVSFLLDAEVPWKRRCSNLVSASAFTILIGVLYYLAVRIWVSSQFTVEMISALGSYEVDANLSGKRLLTRLMTVSDYLWAVPPTNIALFGGTSALLITGFVLLKILSLRGTWNPTSVIRIVAAMALSVILLLSLAVAPWLVSGMAVPESRHLLVWAVFFSGILIGWYRIAEDFWRQFGAPLFVLRSLGVTFLLFTGMIQFQFVRNEVSLSNREFQIYREAIGEWVDRQGWNEERLILVVRPPDATGNVSSNARPPHVASALGTIQTRSYGEIPFARGSVWLASADNPVTIPWMITAALREHEDQLPPDLNEYVFCGASELCMSESLRESSGLVFGYVDSLDRVIVPTAPLWIDVNELVGQSEVVEASVVAATSASSQVKEYGPELLLLSGQPGWHAALPVTYPQFLLFEFGDNQHFQSVTLTPQDGHPRRMPSSITVESSRDGETWENVISVKQKCSSFSEDGWRIPFPARHVARWWRVKIKANCGEPEFLTLAGVTFE